MIIFLDENDVEYGALATIKATNAVNGERSITGEIISGDIVLSRIERGWRLRFEDEYYVVTFAKPIDEGKNVQVSFDAVHQFFWDFGKSSVYDQLSDGSHTFRAYLDFIFNGSGYKYDIESSLTVKAFEKQSFGYKNRLSLFNDIITSSGVEFQVNGKVVRILAKVGTDLSTVVRKNFNLNELGIEKNIGDFVTYQKGFGAYFDEEDHSKGRLIAEYTSPLASVYGKLEADPLVDERYKQQESLLSALKNTVDNSYTISVSLDMEDLTRAGYRYTQPIAGDYIMAINETLGFKEKIRIVSFTSEYDVAGQLIKHTVTCNDIGSVKKLSASYTQTQHQAANAEVNANTAYEFANKALVSANGKNTNYYGDTFPVDNPKGTLKKGDLLFLTVGDTVKQYYWNGAEWVTNPVVSDVEAFKEQIAEELKDVPNREEFENKIAEEIANSKAEIETKIETAKTQAESNAKEYADTINEETAKVAELANAAADEIKADLVNVKNNLTSTSIVANNAQAAVDEAKQDLTEVASELNTAKQDLTSHAQQLQTQANAQAELTKRVTTVETTANGTKTTVSELSKTVDSNTKNITSVTARTKVVEDDLTSTKTTLSQVKTTAESTSQKTATLETGLDGLSAKFSNLKIGGRNLLTKTNQGKTNWDWSISDGGTTAEDYYVGSVNAVKLTRTADAPASWSYVQYQGLLKNLIEPSTEYTLSFDVYPSQNVTFTATLKQGNSADPFTNDVAMNQALANKWTKVFCTLTSKETLPSPSRQVVYLSGMPIAQGNYLIIKNIKLEKGNVATDYSPSEVDFGQKVAEYKQDADQNYASLQNTVQALDGTVKQNKSEFDQTASQIKSSISSVESKIPTSIGGRNLWIQSKATGNFVEETLPDNHITGQKKCYRIPNYNELSFNIEPNFSPRLYQKVTFSAWVKYDNVVRGQNSWNVFNCFKHSLYYKNSSTGATTNANYLTLEGFTGTSDWKRITYTYDYAANKSYDQLKTSLKFNLEGVRSGTAWVTGIKIEFGSIPSDYTPAPEDTAEQISSLSSEIKQTADGITLLATKTELNAAKNELQSGIKTATDKANNNAQTITTHTTQISALNNGLSAKVSQSDFNTLSGRVTNAENNIIAKANELSSKITSVEGKIPTSVSQRNLAQGTSVAWSPFVNITTKNNWRYGLATINYGDKTGIYAGTTINLFVYLSADEIVLDSSISPQLFIQGEIIDKSGNATWINWDKYHPFYNKWSTKLVSGNNYRIVKLSAKVSNESYSNINGFKIEVRINGVKSGKFHHRALMVTTGDVFPDSWQPAPEDAFTQINSVSSEFKQTTNAIKASVSSLDSSTVKSSSLTINADGIVMKAGKSTSDFANAVGSYFGVNQNAINLFSDKINVKGNMIVNGAITSDKIASKSINTAHLNGKIITADVISSNAVTASAIKAGAVTTDKMSANSINGDRITAGTLDAAKIRVGSITASQIASGTITSAQIKTGTISAANIAAGAITASKIAAGAIDASKIAANAITANMITGGQLRSTNGATVFDLNAGTLTFNNNYGYIQRAASDKVFEITTWLHNADGSSQEYLTSAFKIRKSDYSRLAGAEFTLYNATEDKPTALAKINADTLILSDSKNTTLFAMYTKGAFGNVNFQGWRDIPVASLHNSGLLVKDIGIGGHSKSLLKIVEELCKKTGIPWV